MRVLLLELVEIDFELLDFLLLAFDACQIGFDLFLRASLLAFDAECISASAGVL